MGGGLLTSDASLREAALGHPNTQLGFLDLRLRRFGRGSVRRGSRHRCVVLLLRDLVLRQQWLQPLDVLRRLRRIRRSLTLPRLRRHQTRASNLDALLGLEIRGLRPLDTTACRHLVARGRRRCDRNADARSGGGRFSVCKLRARPIERDLVVARVDLDEHGTHLDFLIRLDGHTQHSPANTRRDRRDMRIHLRIVGGLAPRGDPPPDSRANGYENGYCDKNPNTLAHLVTEPPRYLATASSAVPRDRASMAFATLKP